MKLPDFKAFEALNKPRERMKAEMSEDSFVQINDRLSVSDLEEQRRREQEPLAVPGQPAPQAVAKPAPGQGQQRPVIKYVAVDFWKSRRNIVYLLLSIQFIVMINAVLLFAYLHFVYWPAEEEANIIGRRPTMGAPDANGGKGMFNYRDFNAEYNKAHPKMGGEGGGNTDKLKPQSQ